MINNVSRRIKDNHSISFSVYQDYLPMWKIYGDGGRGVMLTFDTKEIAKHWPGLLQPCLYMGTIEYKQTKDKILNAKSHQELKELSTDLQNTIMMWMLQLFVSIAKNEKYMYEKEVRLIGLGNRFFGDDSMQQYRVSNNQIIPYVEVHFPSVALKEICLGPLSSNKSNKQTLTEFLSHKGYENVAVTTSKIRYR